MPLALPLWLRDRVGVTPSVPDIVGVPLPLAERVEAPLADRVAVPLGLPLQLADALQLPLGDHDAVTVSVSAGEALREMVALREREGLREALLQVAVCPDPWPDQQRHGRARCAAAKTHWQSCSAPLETSQPQRSIKDLSSAGQLPVKQSGPMHGARRGGVQTDR